MGMPYEPARFRGGLPDHPWLRSYEGGLLWIAFPARASDGEVTEFTKASYAFWSHVTGKVSVLVDCRAVLTASPSQRKLFAEYQRLHEPLFAQKMLGAAFLIDSALVRGLLTAIFWLQPPRYKHSIVAGEEEALRFLSGLAERE